MKSTYKLLLPVVALFLLAGCDYDEFLTVENENNLSAGSFWKTETDFQEGLVATYGALQLSGLLGGTATTQLPVRSDVGRPNNWNANARSLQTLGFNENTAVVKEKWQSCYIGVYRANQVIQNLANADIDEDAKTQIEAEARFLRGFYYYALYRGYNKGSVILHVDVPGSSDDFYTTPSPAEDVYAQILSDLEFAEANLPLRYDNADDLGRATWGAAASMLGKLHINEHDYNKAAEYFKDVIDSGVYSLTADIADNWGLDHEFNSESIFEVAFSAESKPGTGGGAQDGPTGSEATNRARVLAPGSGGGWRVVMPSYWMTMQFRNDTADVNNPVNAGRVREDGTAGYSYRSSMSIAIADDVHSTYFQKPSDQAGYGNGEASYMKKFQNWTWIKEDPMQISSINERVIRLADVMLLYAECLLQTGGSFDEAFDIVNTIRARGGSVLLKKEDYTPESLMEHIMWTERPLELMFEGHDLRWDDLVRWGKTKEHYERLAEMKFVQVQKVLHYYDPENPDHEGAKILQEYIEAANIYNPDVHDYFPIPSTELTSNPGFFGE